MLGSIAEDYGVSVADIRRWNGLSGDFIREGQHLTIRSTTTSTASARTSAPRASSAASPARSSAAGSSTYVVQSGDTLGGIAARVGASVEDLVSWNRGLDPDRIRVGQELSVRSGGRVTRRVEYIVARGDTAGAIAERHG
ncbi:MAG: LysM peptidoglycan-binding domain-containing protein, partial [Myxococcales bacterium]|nr:LysM peptidoglycan-binding domain-containing protein [Myxococcales bacterium]